MNKKRTVLTLVTLLVFGAIIALHYITPNIFEYFRFRGGGGGGGTDLGWVNVKDAPYNATGDGVTDETAAIQAAINAVFASGGGVVFFPKGIYLCNGAFDATTNSILKIPYQPMQVAGVWNQPVTVELRGEIAPAIAAVPPLYGSIIKTTKTGTGTAPSLLAAYAYLGRLYTTDYIHLFSYVQVILRNLQFEVPVNPTIDGVRLETAVMAILEDVVITTATILDPNAVEPTHGTVGLWMPSTNNFGTSYCNRVWAAGFDTGIVASSEGFRAPQVGAMNCHVALELVGGAHSAWFNLNVNHCKTILKCTSIGGVPDKCMFLAYVDAERITNDGQWQYPAAGGELLDPSNIAYGEIRYQILELSVGESPIKSTGGNNLRLINLVDGQTVYFGTDLRMVPITGGGKLQARNPGTNTWADVDQWTNP